MIDLAELQMLAEDCGDGYIDIGASAAKTLIAVVRAAQALTSYEHTGAPASPMEEGWPLWEEKFVALRAALEELK